MATNTTPSTSSNKNQPRDCITGRFSSAASRIWPGSVSTGREVLEEEEDGSQGAKLATGFPNRLGSGQHVISELLSMIQSASSTTSTVEGRAELSPLRPSFLSGPIRSAPSLCYPGRDRLCALIEGPDVGDSASLPSRLRSDRGSGAPSDDSQSILASEDYRRAFSTPSESLNNNSSLLTSLDQRFGERPESAYEKRFRETVNHHLLPVLDPQRYRRRDGAQDRGTAVTNIETEVTQKGEYASASDYGSPSLHSFLLTTRDFPWDIHPGPGEALRFSSRHDDGVSVLYRDRSGLGGSGLAITDGHPTRRNTYYIRPDLSAGSGPSMTSLVVKDSPDIPLVREANAPLRVANIGEYWWLQSGEIAQESNFSVVGVPFSVAGVQ
ncbi:hypothetical protein P7C73_g383, partial [Tremellales sp. Uapishka_1]